MYFARGDFLRAEKLLRRSTTSITTRVLRGYLDSRVALAGKKTEIEQWSQQFLALIKAAYRLKQQGIAGDLETSREMFLTAQWALGSEAAQSLAQMAARSGMGDQGIAVLARERQNIMTEWLKRDGLRTTWLGQAPNKRNSKAEEENLVRLAAINARIGEIDGTFPGQVSRLCSIRQPCSVEHRGGSGSAPRWTRSLCCSSIR